MGVGKGEVRELGNNLILQTFDNNIKGDKMFFSQLKHVIVG